MKKVIVLVLIIGFALSITSCRTGYGCKGRSKYITGHKPNGY
jgi:hypothetical protein